MNTHLLQTQLEDYAAAAPYPLHMPGHKRRVNPAPGLPAAWDVTEVPGVDDLHEAQGILADAMNRAAALWGAQRSWFLVNGSTGGILAAIRAAALTRPGRPIVCARNCHKSVYHAIELNALAVEWMTPPVDPAFGVYGSVTPAQAAAALDRCPGAAALVLTSPTYEGVLSDVAAIAALCHDRDVPLIVDEAHGAHYLPLAQPFGWQGGAVAAGADLVIQSPHKTLPSLTQTALLHQNGGRIPAAAVERQLDVFETSSPSYPLLASLDGCAGLLAAHGTQWFAAWRERLDRFDRAVAPLRRLRVLCHGTDAAKSHPGIFRHDGGKLLVSGAGAGWTGAALADRLRRDGFETEMACGANVLAMTSPCDAEDALDRLAAALLAVDAASAAPAAPLPPPLPEPGAAACPIAEAVRRPVVTLPLAQAAGRVAAEYLWAYPPGVPLIAPGERIPAGFAAAAAALESSGTRLRHTGATLSDQISVLA